MRASAQAGNSGPRMGGLVEDVRLHQKVYLHPRCLVCRDIRLSVKHYAVGV